MRESVEGVADNLSSLPEWSCYGLACMAFVFAIFAFKRLYTKLVGTDAVSWKATGLGAGFIAGISCLLLGPLYFFRDAISIGTSEAFIVSTGVLSFALALSSAWKADGTIRPWGLVKRMICAPFEVIAVALRTTLAIVPVVVSAAIFIGCFESPLPSWAPTAAVVLGFAITLGVFVLDWDEWEIILWILSIAIEVVSGFVAGLGGATVGGRASVPAEAGRDAAPDTPSSPRDSYGNSDTPYSQYGDPGRKAQMDGAAWHHQNTYDN